MTEHDIACEQALAQIFAFIDHELEDNERRAVERHLDVCKSCFSRAVFERRLKERLHGLREQQPSEAVRARLLKLLQSFGRG